MGRDPFGIGNGPWRTIAGYTAILLFVGGFAGIGYRWHGAWIAPLVTLFLPVLVTPPDRWGAQLSTVIAGERSLFHLFQACCLELGAVVAAGISTVLGGGVARLARRHALDPGQPPPRRLVPGAVLLGVAAGTFAVAVGPGGADSLAEALWVPLVLTAVLAWGLALRVQWPALYLVEALLLVMLASLSRLVRSELGEGLFVLGLALYLIVPVGAYSLAAFVGQRFQGRSGRAGEV